MHDQPKSGSLTSKSPFPVRFCASKNTGVENVNVLEDEDVLRLQVAVHHIVRMTICQRSTGEALTETQRVHLRGDLLDVLHGHALHPFVCDHQVEQRPLRSVLHHNPH